MSYGRIVEASTSRYLMCPSGILRRQRSLDISAGEQALYLVDRGLVIQDEAQGGLTKVGPRKRSLSFRQE